MEEFTVLENVTIPLLIGGAQKAEALEAAAAMLREVGLESRMSHFPSKVSGGERQRAAIARALVAKPDVVLADEPTGNLDPVNGERLRDLIRQLSSEHGQAFVIATHSAALSEGADRSYRLVSGLLLREGVDCDA
jgi:lipoprotein-releasing system ATP-binding protein